MASNMKATRDNQRVAIETIRGRGFNLPTI